MSTLNKHFLMLEGQTLRILSTLPVQVGICRLPLVVMNGGFLSRALSREEGTQQSFIRVGSASRCNPLYPFYMPFMTDWYPFRIPSFYKWYPFYIPTILDKTVEKIVHLRSIFLNIVAVPVLHSPASPESNVVVYSKESLIPGRF